MKKIRKHKKMKQDTETEHFCEKVNGKAIHVEVDGNNKWYCCYCHKELLSTQLIRKNQREYERRKEYKK